MESVAPIRLRIPEFKSLDTAQFDDCRKVGLKAAIGELTLSRKTQPRLRDGFEPFLFFNV